MKSIGSLHRIQLLVLTCVTLCLFSCQRSNTTGNLLVKFAGNGTYDIYRIVSETPLQFVSEQTGNFNSSTKLLVGSYLVIADCSSKIVNITPSRTIEIHAHKINFIPLQPPSDEDRFSIQCQRSGRTKSWQQIEDRYSLSILSGTRDLLVGMIPIELKLEESEKSLMRPVSFLLSSLTVIVPQPHKSTEKMADIETTATKKALDIKSTPPRAESEFFVTPQMDAVPYTESQRAGRKLYVLKGLYKVQLNGTETTVDLKEGEGRAIMAGVLRVSTPPGLDLGRVAKIKGSPHYVEINDSHYLFLNTDYSVLPGTIRTRLSTMLRPVEISIKEGEITDLVTKSVTVHLNCSLDAWSCLGSRKVRLFEKGKSFPFSESVTDVPVLYFASFSPLIGIEGSRDIKKQLNEQTSQDLYVGYLEITPSVKFKPGLLTDLIRIEPNSSSFFGNSLDVQLDKTSTIPLLAGNYDLAQYTYSISDGVRKKSVTRVSIVHGQTVSNVTDTYVTEKRLQQLKSN